MLPGNDQKVKKLRIPCQHVGLSVHNLKKMNRFYTKELGFAALRDYVVDAKMTRFIFGIDAACRIQYLQKGDFGLELFYFYHTKLRKLRNKISGLNHWAFLVADKEDFCRRLAKKGIKVIRIPKPHGYTYFIKDPESNMLEVKSYELTGQAERY